VLSVVFLIILGVLMFYTIQKAIKEGPPTLRTFTAMEAIVEGSERAIEEGKLSVMFPGTGSLRGARVTMTMAYLNFLRYMGEQAAKRGVTVKAPASSLDVVPLQQAALREAYTKMGRPDLYNDDMVEFFGSSGGYLFACFSMFESPGASLAVAVGSLGGSSPAFMGAARQKGSLTVGGSLRWTAMYGVALLCDYILIADEVYAASETIANDPENLGAIQAIDYLKILLLLIGIVGVVGLALGLPTVDWLRM
jgi:hypothetical protein